MRLEYLSASDLKPGPWKVTYILRPDLKSLASSLSMFGWTQPIVVKDSTLEIIDGHERVALAQNNALGSAIPCVIVEADNIDCSLMHVHLNRSRGGVRAKGLSHLIRKILRSHKYTESGIITQFALSRDEMDVLIDGTLLKQRKVAEHSYSRAWVPVEAPSGTYSDISFEHPPTSDQEQDSE